MRRAEPVRPDRAAPGFSLVELLVAVMFIGLLMAGLATVFKTSLGSYVVAAETTSSSRQNTLALETLFDDLNIAGMTPSNLYQSPSAISSANPAFEIIPNVGYANTDVPIPTGSSFAGPVTDQLYLYFDQFMPYAVTVGSTALQGTSSAVAGGLALGNTNAFTLKFNASEGTLAANAFTTAVTAGFTPVILLQATGTTANINSLDSLGNITISSVQTQTNTGTFANGAPTGSVVNLIIPGCYVRYQIQPVALDPSNTGANTLTPCLVRTLVPYPGSGAAAWGAPYSSTIVADNVTAFHVGLSADGGKTWAGTDSTTATGWSYTTAAWSGITGALAGASAPTLNAQLATLNTTAASVDPAGIGGTGGPFWFRQYPMLVRIDITTRTVNKRSDYTRTGQADYKYQTRTMILNPRHFGLHY